MSLFNSAEFTGIAPASSSMMPTQPYVSNRKNSPVDVGQNRLSDSEMVRHIADVRFLRSLAQARLRGSQSASDAAEVARWDAALTEAIQARQAAYRDEESDFGGGWAVELARRCG